MLSRRVDSRVFFLISLFLVALACPGCRRPAEESHPETDAKPASPDGDHQDVVREFEAGFRDLMSRLERSPDPPSKKQLSLRAFIQNAKQAETRLGLKLPSVQSAEAELQKMMQAREKELEDSLRQLEEKVMALLDGPERDVDKASRVLEEFPVQGSREGPGQERLEALKQKLELYQQASIDAVARKFRAEGQEDPVQAIAILEGFDPAYDKTPFAEEIRTLVRAQYARYAELRGGNAPAGGGVPRWEDFDLNAHSVLWPQGPRCTRVEGDVLSIGPNDPKAIETDEKDLNLAAGTCVQFVGGEDWIDVELKFEAQVVAGEGIFFGARGYEGSHGYNFHWLRVADLKIADEEWHSFLVRVEGTSLIVSDLSAKQLARNDRLRPEAGPFGIRVAGDKAVLRLRKLQVWIKSKRGGGEGGATAAGEGPAKKAGKKGRAAKKGTGT